MSSTDEGSDTSDARRVEVGDRRAEEDSRGLHEDAVAADRGIDRAHDRFGGFDIPAQLTGMLVAVALTLLLGGIAGAIIGSIAYQTGLKGNLSDISIGSLITGLVVLFIAFLIGGWAAGRIARYDGGRNGLMTAVWFLILTAILAALGIWFGTQYNVVGNVNLPNWFDAWFSSDKVTTGAAISGIAAVIVSLLGGFLGGLWGQRFHKRADETIARTRSGGITTDYSRRGVEER
jgi:hypothetical protein